MAFAFGPFASLLFLGANIAAHYSCEEPYSCYRGLGHPALTSVVFGLVLLGVVAMLDGMVFVSNRRLTRCPDEAQAAGALCIAGGACLASVLLAILGGFFVLGAGLLIGGVVLVRPSCPIGARSMDSSPSSPRKPRFRRLAAVRRR